MTRLPSIRRRLLVALMLMTLLTLTVASGLSALMDLRLFRDHMLRDLRVLATVVGQSCVSALVFNNKESAEQRLATLAGEYQIRSATLFDAQEQTMAYWQRTPVGPPTNADEVRIEHPLDFDGRPIGRLVLNARLDELERQTRTYAWLGGAVVLFTLAVALAIALGLQRRIARPILALEDAIRTVSAREDFRLRVPAPRAEREVDALARAFNRLLAQVEQRETALRHSNDGLRQANAALRRLASDLSMLEEAEKARLADELHDGPMQELALALIQITAGVELRRGDSSHEADRAEAEEQLAAGIELMRETIDGLRTLQFDLSPPLLHQRGLVAALEWLADNTRERWGIALTCGTDAELPAFDRRQSTVLFRCARELVNNLIKHSGARNGAIVLRMDGERVELSVTDDGGGFQLPAGNGTPSAPEGGYGLHSIRERLELLGGSLSIHSTANGSRSVVRLPIASE